VLVSNAVAARIAAGEITVAFRWWRRPTVKAGGTLITQAGQLAIDEVTVIEPAEVTDVDARAAGFESADEALDDLGTRPDRRLHRVRFHLLGDDPRVALRAQASLTAAERATLDKRLDRWDDAGPSGPWTRAILDVIAEHPGVVSTDLAPPVGLDRPTFKRRVRQLKSLGLTESLEVGYRLSPRGRALRAGAE
jgi:hypothetical protein